MMKHSNPHLIKNASLFAMFCLSYFPLFFLLGLKITIANVDYLNFNGIDKHSIYLFFKHFGFVVILIGLSVYAFLGTYITFRKITKSKSNAEPCKIVSIKPKNEEALSYLATYVIPLLAQGIIGAFEYATFAVLFIIYYKLYSSSSLILINPILNMRYGLFDLEFARNGKTGKTQHALVISKNNWLNEDDNVSLVKLSHRLYFAT